MVKSALAPDTLTATAPGSYTAAPAGPIDWATRRGWYVNLLANAKNSGERILSPATTLGGTFVATSYMATPGANNLCVPAATSFIYQLNYATGAGAVTQTTGTVGGVLIVTLAPSLGPSSPITGPNGGPSSTPPNGSGLPPILAPAASTSCVSYSSGTNNQRNLSAITCANSNPVRVWRQPLQKN